MDWDDVRVFLAVAESGRLRAAARTLGISQPTAGRRLQALEQAIEGSPLFERLADGHSLTARGAELLPAARLLAEAASAFELKAAGGSETVAGVVRLSLGEWPAFLVASRIDRFRAELPAIRLELGGLKSGKGIDLTRRDADVGILEDLPAVRRDGTQSLVVRKLGSLAYAIYGSRAYVESNPAASSEGRFQDCLWLAPDELAATAEGEGVNRPLRWLTERVPVRAIKVRCATSSALLRAAHLGAGLIVLPCFVGDAETGLVRVSTGQIVELSTELWLGVHPEMQRKACIRAVMDFLVSLFEAAEPELLGSAPYSDRRI